MADGLLNKASIILTPTGYKAGTLYNVAPVVEPYEDFDFARASVASRVNSSGLVEMVGRTLSSELITDGSFPDGTTAWTFSNPGGTHGWRIADGKAICDTNAATANRNLSSSLSLDSSKDYKLTIDILQSADNITVYVGGTALSPKLPTSEILGYEYYISSSDHSGGVLMFYAGSSDLQEIDNVSVKEIIDTNNIPRINYDSNGDNGHILLEPTSTNLITYSEDFSQWILGSNATLTYESDVVAPDGSLGVYRLTLPAQSGTFIYFPISNSNQRTCSVYAKSASVNDEGFNILLNLGSSKFSTNNEWQRFEFTDSGSGNVSFINSGDTFITDIYIWGAQLEELSYATSYIPTLTGSTETRATETATGAGSADLINSTEGVLYAEIAALADDLSNRMIALSDSDSSDHVRIYYTNSTNKISVAVKSNGSNQYIFLNHNVTDITNFIKIAVKYKANDFATFINGVKVNSQTTTASAPIGLDRLNFDSGAGLSDFYGKCKALAVFNEALSDSELTQLTT